MAGSGERKRKQISPLTLSFDSQSENENEGEKMETSEAEALKAAFDELHLAEDKNKKNDANIDQNQDELQAEGALEN
jgi:hypothetical protein